MKRIVLAGFSLNPRKPPLEVERDRQWVKELLKQMEVREYHEAPFGFDFDIEVDNPAFEAWIQALQQRPDLIPRFVRVERLYTEKELDAAPLLLWRITSEAIQDDYYGLYPGRDKKGVGDYVRRCEVCGAPLEQIRDMLLNTRRMPKGGLSLTYGFEIILAPWLARALQEAGFTGFTLRPAWHYTRPHQGEPPLYQLVVTHTLPPMASPPTEVENVQHCDVCGTTSRFLKNTHYWEKIRYYEETDIYYTREAFAQAQDFNRTAELFGVLRVAKPYVLISQRVYRWLREHKIRGWKVVPVYEVEETTKA